MNRAKSISVDNKSCVMKTILDFQAANETAEAGKKDRMQRSNLRILLEKELDLVVGRSIN